MSDYLLGALIIVPLAIFEAFVFWRYPDFRRAFIAYWSSDAIARRLNAWAEAQKKRP